MIVSQASDIWAEVHHRQIAKKRSRFWVLAPYQRVRLLCPPRQAPPRWQASLVGSYLLPNCINRETLMREDDSGDVLALPVADCPGI